MSASIAIIMEKMIAYSDGNMHDINHFMKVWTYAKTIGELEGLDENTQYILEVAAILHDIACPLCRKKYGSTIGRYQEMEGILLTYDFLQDMELPKEQLDRVAFLVGHHHTYDHVDGLDYRILLEADYLVNADEASYSMNNIRKMKSRLFETATGIRLLESLYPGCKESE